MTRRFFLSLTSEDIALILGIIFNGVVAVMAWSTAISNQRRLKRLREGRGHDS